MPLWLKNHFNLRTIEKKQIQAKLSALPICLKPGHTFVWVFPSPFHQEGQNLFGDDALGNGGLEGIYITNLTNLI